MKSSQDSLLSVVVVIVSDTTSRRGGIGHLTENLRALEQQIDPPPIEIIVPYHPRVEGIEKLKREFPEVSFRCIRDLPSFNGQRGYREHHDELRSRGLSFARGDIVGLLEDHGRPDPLWGRNMMEGHQSDYAAIGGAIENGIDRPLNWAVYFCDFFRYQSPLPDGESTLASDANASYKRSALETIKPILESKFQETEVNQALMSQGYKLGISSRAVVYQHRQNLHLRSAIKERFIWGRSYAASRGKLLSFRDWGIYALFSPFLPVVLLSRITASVAKKGRLEGSFFKSFPLTAMLCLSWSLGEWIGYLTGRATSSSEVEGKAPLPVDTGLSKQ